MANEKKYSEKEAAIAVLNKAKELLAKSSLMKPAETMKKSAEFTSGLHTVEYFEPLDKAHAFKRLQEKLEREGHSKDSAGKIAYEAGVRSIGKEAMVERSKAARKSESLDMSEKLKKDGTSTPNPNSPSSMGVPSGVLGAMNIGGTHKSELYKGEWALCEKHGGKAAMKKGEGCSMCKHGLSPDQVKQKLGKSEYEELYEDLAKMEKAEGDHEHKDKAPKENQGAGNKEAPSSPPEDHSKPTEREHSDFEAKPGNAAAPDHREASQTPPQANPKEQAEGNNPVAGSVPGKGLHKLMYFTGHVHAKKKMKKGICLG